MDQPENITPVALLRHDNAEFDDQIVYATGNAYFGCDFTRCVILLKGFPFHFNTCKFIGCIWHIDIVIHDHGQLNALRALMDDVMTKSLPIVSIPENPEGPPDPSAA